MAPGSSAWGGAGRAIRGCRVLVLRRRGASPCLRKSCGRRLTVGSCGAHSGRTLWAHRRRGPWRLCRLLLLPPADPHSLGAWATSKGVVTSSGFVSVRDHVCSIALHLRAPALLERCILVLSCRMRLGKSHCA